MIHLDTEPVTEGYIEIVDVKSGHRVITSIEVLSPANKHAGEGQRLFLQKRDDMTRAGVNIGGDRPAARRRTDPDDPVGSRSRRRIGRITRFASGGPRSPGPSWSTRLRSASDCRSSRSRCGRPIRMRLLDLQPRLISVIAMAGTMTSTTPMSPSPA